jgi:hypothetical protein
MDCFYELKIKSTCRQRLYDYAMTEENWEQGGFFQKSPPPKLYEDDPVFGRIVKDPKSLTIMKMFPSSYYNLHADKFRTCCLNLLLNETYHSYTYFNTGWIVEGRQNQCYIKTIEYELDKCYLFNTRISHGVINFGDKERFVLTYGWNPELYPEIKEILIGQGF